MRQKTDILVQKKNIFVHVLSCEHTLTEVVDMILFVDFRGLVRKIEVFWALIQSCMVFLNLTFMSMRVDNYIALTRRAKQEYSTFCSRFHHHNLNLGNLMILSAFIICQDFLLFLYLDIFLVICGLTNASTLQYYIQPQPTSLIVKNQETPLTNSSCSWPVKFHCSIIIIAHSWHYWVWILTLPPTWYLNIFALTFEFHNSGQEMWKVFTVWFHELSTKLASQFLTGQFLL